MTTMTRSRSFVSRTYSGPRRITMIMLLGVVGMLMYNAGNPLNWKWVEEQPPEPSSATSPTIAPLDQKTQERYRYDATSKDYNEKSVKTDDPTNKNFHWDEDPEEKDEFRNEATEITDKSTEIQPEEMFPYARLLRWVQTRAYQDLLKSSKTNFIFNDLLQDAVKNRGRLVKIPLRVARILPYDMTDPTTHKTSTVYEVWGRNPSMMNWLYVVIVPELPEGMPSGNTVDEQVTFVGYFFKVQGYYEVKAAANSKPSRAPLLIGRMAWEPAVRRTPLVRHDWDSDWTWYVLGGVFAGYLGLRWWIKHGPTKKAPVNYELDHKDADKIATWLENADADSIPDDIDPDDVEIPEAKFDSPNPSSKKNRRRKS